MSLNLVVSLPYQVTSVIHAKGEATLLSNFLQFLDIEVYFPAFVTLKNVLFLLSNDFSLFLIFLFSSFYYSAFTIK